jgi:hypothetical protein
MEKFRNKVQQLLDDRFGISVSDCLSKDRVEESYLNGETVEELVEWVGKKYDLIIQMT